MTTNHILKDGETVGTFDYDPNTLKFNLKTKDRRILLASKSVLVVKSKYDVEHDAMMSFAVEAAPGDQGYVHGFLSILRGIGYNIST